MKRVIFALFFFLAIPFSAFASNIDTTNKFARFLNTGSLINFGPTNGNVTVTDTAITGYAWGADVGWINLSPAQAGIINDGHGVLYGYAWGENTGWINFKPAGGGVTIDSSGNFNGYAWSETRGWIVFNCATDSSCGTLSHKVKTSWTPPVTTTTNTNSASSGGPIGLYGTVNTQKTDTATSPGQELGTTELGKGSSSEPTSLPVLASEPTSPIPNSPQSSSQQSKPVSENPTAGSASGLNGQQTSTSTFQDKVFGTATSLTNGTSKLFLSIKNLIVQSARSISRVFGATVIGGVTLYVIAITGIVAVLLLFFVSRIRSLFTLAIVGSSALATLWARIRSLVPVRSKKEITNEKVENEKPAIGGIGESKPHDFSVASDLNKNKIIYWPNKSESPVITPTPTLVVPEIPQIKQIETPEEHFVIEPVIEPTIVVSAPVVAEEKIVPPAPQPVMTVPEIISKTVEEEPVTDFENFFINKTPVVPEGPMHAVIPVIATEKIIPVIPQSKIVEQNVKGKSFKDFLKLFIKKEPVIPAVETVQSDVSVPEKQSTVNAEPVVVTNAVPVPVPPLHPLGEEIATQTAELTLKTPSVGFFALFANKAKSMMGKMRGTERKFVKKVAPPQKEGKHVWNPRPPVGTD